MSEVRIEYMSLADLVPWARNPKKHDLGDIKKSITRFGFVAPVILDDKKKRIVAGHGRVEACVALRNDWEAVGKKPRKVPGQIQVADDGDWRVPVLRGKAFKNEKEAEAYLMADNRLGEKGGWSQPDLAAMLQDATTVSLDGIGWDTKEVNAIIADVEKKSGTGKAKEAKEAPDELPDGEPTVKEGQIWQLGPHRLMCGDSTKNDAVDALLDGAAVDMVLTDPPYAIYGSSTGIGEDIADDKMVRPFFEGLFTKLKRVVKKFGHIYVHNDWRTWAAIMDSARRSGVSLKNCIVWDKGSQGLGSMYTQCHEFIGFFVRSPTVRAMKSAEATGQRMVYRPNIIRENRVGGKERKHNAAKPVGLLQELIRNGSDKGETVLDLFGGSGSTLLAADAEGRRCLVMEIEPKWCDVIIDRWESISGGEKAKLLSD